MGIKTAREALLNYIEEHDLSIPFGGVRGACREIAADHDFSASAVRNAYYALKAEDEEPEDARRDAPPEEPKGVISLERDYFYNDSADLYVIWLPHKAGTLHVEGETVREMKRAYSEMPDGYATINEICTAFGWRRKDFTAFKRIMGWTHDEDPFTDEEHVSTSTQDLVEDYSRIERGEFERALRKKEWRETIDDAKKWRDLSRETLKPMLARLENSPIRKGGILYESNRDPFAVVMFPTDLHLDQKNADGTGFTENRARAIAAHASLLETIKRQGRPEIIDLTLGSDQFNIDNMAGQTTRGTPQDNDLLPDRSVAPVADVGVELVEMAREIAPVRLRVVPGNHDYRSCLLYFWGLSQKYAGVEGVEVVGSARNYQYATYGANLFGWHHGHDQPAGRTNSAQKFTGQMACDVPELWGESTHRYWMIGHREHLWEHDDGVHVMQAPTTKKADRYHRDKGFTKAQNVQVCWAFRRRGGQCARFMSG